MKLNTEIKGDVAIVRIDGDHLDASTHAKFVQQLKPVTDQYSKIIFDIGSLEFIDSSGIGVILGTMRRARATGGDVKLACPTEAVTSIFNLVRMSRLINIVPTIDEAVAGFGQ
ncbi:MAG TPA: STAS domain-containing protein [Phycisphaerae bacterium]|nr:STAS domain-containing protein [Phycisphaerae bacterium]HPS52909.1 STAS domain-containing protein [Phycisphaerae bacterium]